MKVHSFVREEEPEYSLVVVLQKETIPTEENQTEQNQQKNN
jgi:hypothetical protein